jgi:Ca2+/Na+ antiporter
MRDGLSLIAVSAILLILLLGTKLSWWQGLLLMALYGIYLWYMIGTMKANGGVDEGEGEEGGEEDGEEEDVRGLVGNLCYWCSLGPLLDLERIFVGPKQREQIKEETWNGWPMLVASALVIGLACWILVKGCEWLGTGAANEMHPSFHLFGLELSGIGMPTMFVAVIFASMATSVPDTIISIRDARDGDYDDAVANALGSNIFDICFALGFPLFLYTVIYGPIEMRPETIEQSGELRFLLLLLTVGGFLVFLVGSRTKGPNGGKQIKLGRGNAVALLAFYLAFLVYIVGRSTEAAWTVPIADWIDGIVQRLPVL